MNCMYTYVFCRHHRYRATTFSRVLECIKGVLYIFSDSCSTQSFVGIHTERFCISTLQNILFTYIHTTKNTNNLACTVAYNTHTYIHILETLVVFVWGYTQFVVWGSMTMMRMVFESILYFECYTHIILFLTYCC